MIILLKFLQFIFYFIFRLPPTAAIYLMHFAAELTYRVTRLTPIKNITAKNIKMVFPEAPTSRLADQLLRNVSYSIFEILCVPFFKEAHFRKVHKIIGLENLDLALAKRKGVILLSMHTGNYELTPAALAAKGYRFNSILKATDDPVFKILNRSRSYQGARLINILKVNMYRESIKTLAENEIVGLLVDTGALEGRYETIDFLGKKVAAATGWLTLAERSAAEVVPSFSKREGKQIHLILGEPLHVYHDNREEVKQKIKQFYENFIKNHPEQWAIFLNEYETKRMVEGK